MFFVRTATEGDVKPLAQLLEETWHATYDGLYGATRVADLLAAWNGPDAIRTRLQNKGGEYLVADDGRRIGGMAFAAMAETLAKTVLLHQLYVHPDHQRRGIGRDLFAEIETCFPDAEILRLEVDPANRGAIAFYEAHGMIEVDRTLNCAVAVSGIAALVMEKPLT